MKKLILIALVAGSCFAFSSCYKKCKNVNHIERAYLMTKYFGNYVPGAWWVYLNRDSTKRDSIWVDNFKTTTITDEDNCLSADELTFDFHSSYYYLYFKPKKNIIGFNGNDLLQNQFYSVDSIGIEHPGFYAKNEKNNFYQIGGIDHPVMQNYQLWSNYVFPEVSIIGRIVVAPDFGIIQYAPTNSSDTFSLIKFHLP